MADPPHFVPGQCRGDYHAHRGAAVFHLSRERPEAGHLRRPRSSSTPQLFEFDTGGPGFFAAYASADPAFSPWWGSNVPTTGRRCRRRSTAACTTRETQWPRRCRCSRRLAAPTPWSRRPASRSARWTPSSTPSRTRRIGPAGQHHPPIDGAFYGDFGASPMYAANGISDLLTQLTFARGAARLPDPRRSGHAAGLGADRTHRRRHRRLRRDVLPDGS